MRGTKLAVLTLPLRVDENNLTKWKFTMYDPLAGMYPYRYDPLSIVPSVGSRRQVRFNKTKGFVKGKTITFNPFDVREYVGTSVPDRVQLRNSIGQATSLIADGDIAAYYDMTQQINPSNAPAQATLVDREIDAALQRAAAKVMSPDADVGMMLAEIGQTLGMLTNPCRALYKEMRNFWKSPAYGVSLKYRIMSRNAKNLSRYFADKWLEYRYGIMPFISDVEAIRQMANGKFLKEANQLYRRKVMNVPIDTGTQSQTYAAASFFYMYAKTFYYTSNVRTVTSKVYYRPMLTAYNLGLNSNDLLNLSWELIPFSFVVDWFVNVGDWLRIISPRDDVYLVGNTTGIKEVSTTTTYTPLVSRYSSGGTLVYPCACKSSFKRVTTKFVRLTGRPLPLNLVVDWDFSSIKHVVDSLALTWQKMSHLKRY